VRIESVPCGRQSPLCFTSQILAPHAACSHLARGVACYSANGYYFISTLPRIGLAIPALSKGGQNATYLHYCLRCHRRAWACCFLLAQSGRCSASVKVQVLWANRRPFALPGLPATLLQLRDSRVPETLALPTLASEYAVLSLQLVPKFECPCPQHLEREPY